MEVLLEELATTTPPQPMQDPLHDLPEVAMRVFAVMLLISITFIINNLVERAHLPVPEAIVTVVIGIIAGGFLSSALVADFNFQSILIYEDKSALQFMLVFIAPIIFAEGYGMKSRVFFQNLTRILTHAFVGTVVSTVIVALIIKNLAPLGGGFGSDPQIRMTMAECLAFGAMISATDPVTTLAIFKQQGLVDKGLSHLYFSVLGESILNDAVGITLFDGFSEFVKKGDEITPSGIANMAGMFCVTFFGSMLLGIACGILTALVLKLARMGAADEEEDHAHFNLAEVLLMLGMSYMPFLLATANEPLSGIVAVLFTGITSRHYAHYNLSEQTRDIYIPIVELLAVACETYTFLLVGIGIFGTFGRQGGYNLSLILWTSLACLIGRACQVYPLAVTVNCCSKSKKFTVREMHVAWFAGLRGAIAFICALCFPGTPQGGSNRKYVISTTLVIVFASMIGMGWPTAWFLKVLKIGEPTAAEEEVSLHEKPPVNEGEVGQETTVPLHTESVTGTSRFARTLGGSRLGFLDKGLMQFVMTKRALEERNRTTTMAQRRHDEIEDFIAGSRTMGGGPGSQPPSFIPGSQPPRTSYGDRAQSGNGSLPPSYQGGPHSYQPGGGQSQPASYVPGQQPPTGGSAGSFGSNPPSYVPGQPPREAGQDGAPGSYAPGSYNRRGSGTYQRSGSRRGMLTNP